MHPDPKFRWTDRAELRAFVAGQRFGKLFVGTSEGPRVAHVPVIWLDDESIGFHLSRGNMLAAHMDGARALLVVDGAHGYVSPDWYGAPDQVPTWNYVAAELEGSVSVMDAGALPALIDALSLDSERRLAPKPIWTRDKMAAGQFDRMMGAITGYVMRVADWRGTCKLGQDKGADMRLGAIEGLEAAGDSAISAMMREGLS